MTIIEKTVLCTVVTKVGGTRFIRMMINGGNERSLLYYVDLEVTAMQDLRMQLQIIADVLQEIELDVPDDLSGMA